MKWVYLVKSNYYGDHAQGNVLGVHASMASAMSHFNVVRDARYKRARIAWDAGPENVPYPEMQRRMASFYVNDKKNPELVEIIKYRVSRSERKR